MPVCSSGGGPSTKLREAERLEHPGAEGVGVVLAGDGVDDLGQHPVRGGGVVLVPASRPAS